MPRYEFHCDKCEAVRDVLASYERSRTLELICTECGGSMHVAPVLSLNIGNFVADAAETDSRVRSATKSCGHSYTCRCGGVKLTRPNPFKADLKEGG